ncbi:MAG TPA: hypothetical protein DD738_06445 [Ruminiclostridium sp.]|nr:hypothetical protein [Ruminiclostridium sp.]
MRKRKKVFIVIIAVLAIWLGITFYFIAQHSVIGKEARIEQTVVFEDMTIELNSLVVCNFEDDLSDFSAPRNKLKDKVLSNLPQSLIVPYVRIQYLYSTPYKIDNEFWRTAFFGKCIFGRQTETTDFPEYFRDNISIRVLDSDGVEYSSESSMRYEDKGQEIDFMIGGRDFLIERLQEGMKVFVKHLESGQEREFEINFQDFVTYKHNNSFGKTFPFPYKL